ncbi:MAG: polyhydroxyalkanoic acid system family protein [Burkholderiaceae bacterium]
MADIKMIKYHALPLAKAKQVVQKAADDLGSEYDLASEWHGDTLRFHRSGVEGQMKVTASEIHLDVTLGFLLRPFKAKFVEHIEHNFDRLLARAVKAAEKPAMKPPARKAAKKAGRKA